MPKKVVENSSSSPSELKDAKQKLEKGFEELAKQAAQAGGGTDPTTAADSAAQADPSSGSEKSKDEDIVDADFEVVDDDKEPSKNS